MAPSLTILMNTYNVAPFIALAVQSILSQRGNIAFEFWIVDDGSNDGTWEALHQFKDPRLTLTQNPANLGIGATRNRILPEIQTEFIAFMDGDDIATPHRIETQLNVLKKHPNLHGVGSAGLMFRADQGPYYCQKYPKHPAFTHAQLLLNNPILHPTAMLRRKTLEEVQPTPHGRYYNETLRVNEDYDFWIRFCEKFQLSNVSEGLLYYRVHPHSTSQNIPLKACSKMETLALLLKPLLAHHEDSKVRQLSPECMALHMTLAAESGGFIPTLAFLDAAREWIYTLRHGNAEASIFHPTALDAVLWLRWTKLKHHIQPFLNAQEVKTLSGWNSPAPFPFYSPATWEYLYSKKRSGQLPLTSHGKAQRNYHRWKAHLKDVMPSTLCSDVGIIPG